MQNPPSTLTQRESQLLLEKLLYAQGTPITERRSVRNHCMALLMLDSGLRVGEVVSLRTADLMFGTDPVTAVRVRACLTKNNLERTVPLSHRTILSLSLMATHWWDPPYTFPENFAFYRQNTRRPLSTRTVERFIRKAALDAFNRPVHPHMLRHTFATRLMRITSIRVVQTLLGHHNITSTQVYTHPDAEDLQLAIDQMDHQLTQ